MGEKEPVPTLTGIDALTTWLDRRWGDHPCPVCSYVNWRIQDQVFMTVEDPATISKNGKGIFAIPISCMNCGCMLLINKRIIKELMESEEEEG